MRLILMATVCLLVMLTGNAIAQDIDGDGIADSVDNCPGDFNPDQEDSDQDSVGDSCESCCRYVGDINHDGANGGFPDIADLIYLVGIMFSGSCDAACNDSPEQCYIFGILPETDVNCDGSSQPGIDDLIFLVSYMFQEGPFSPCWEDYMTPACNRP